MEDTGFRKRPVVLTPVGIFISAVVTGVTAITIIINKDTLAWQQTYGMSSTELIWIGIIQGILALVLFGVGYGVMIGAGGSRLLVAIVFGVRLAVDTWYMLTHLGEGAFQWQVAIQVVFALFVLWALYGNEKSQRYFESFEGWTAA